MAVYFISDLHLKAERPDITRAFLHFIETQLEDAESLYLLGDIFEAWIGDDTPISGFEEIVAALAALGKRGCKIYFQHGNRDFLVGQEFLDRIGAQLIPEQQFLSLPGFDAVILHGDQLCSDDTEYQQFRQMVRNPAWQQGFLSKTLQERIAIAQQLRDTSKERGAEKAQYIMDVNAEAVTETMVANHCNIMIHGHTHRPDIHDLTVNDQPAKRIVLGDWDKQGWYLRVDNDGYQLQSFEIQP